MLSSNAYPGGASQGFARLNWPVLLPVLGLSVLVLPTIMSLAVQHWSTSNGAHAPLILVSGLWLIWREREQIKLRPNSISTWWLALLAPLLLLYAYGRTFGLLGTESASVYGVLILLGFYYWGPTVMLRLWFPVLYLGFLVKPPYGLVAELTQPLKIWISGASVDVLGALGYPVAHAGVRIQVAQYELLVQQACAGLASLVTLLAMGLLYVHLTQPSSRFRTAFLLLAILPVALLANFLRVLLLLLLTYHFGDSVAQSIAHDATGLITFSLSMVSLFLLDQALGSYHRRAET